MQPAGDSMFHTVTANNNDNSNDFKDIQPISIFNGDAPTSGEHYLTSRSSLEPNPNQSGELRTFNSTQTKLKMKYRLKSQAHLQPQLHPQFTKRTGFSKERKEAMDRDNILLYKNLISIK